jgi:hypothetical protein
MAGTWSGLTHQPTFNTSTMILLTDGRVMVQEEGTNHWHALTPDNTGSYVNGTWSSLADMQYFRRYYASGVLKDGRVIVCGGEQNNVGTGDDTNNCQMYNPATNAWSNVPPPAGWSQIGDASCCVLPDGRLMIGSLGTTACAIYNPSTNSWSNAANKAIRSNEETWILLPDNTILTAQCFSPYQSEKYIISSNTWKNEGAIPVSLINHTMAEIGPAMLLYNGKVIFFGADGSSGHGKSALYTLPSTPTGTGNWTAGPDIPKVGSDVMVCNDCPASLLPNGKVLFAAAKYLSNDWGSPIYFFEYDPVANTITQAPTPSNNNPKLYWSRLMLLPAGQVMFSPSSNNVQVYTPDGAPQNAWRPKTTSVKPHLNYADYLVKGTQLNGLSQANIYGDDCYPATNYPLVRLRDSAAKVHYCKTYKFSTMGVATGPNPHSFYFDPKGLPLGTYHMNVIANGIPSADIALKLVTGVIAKRSGDFDGDGIAEILVTSPWGIGILKQSGATMIAVMMAPNGTRFGGWLLNTVDNTIGEIADYDGDGHDEIIITSPWGIGILKLSGASLTAPMMAPNGTRFGGWLLNTDDNNFGPAADYDGDHHAEVLVTSPWGVGILKLSGSTLTVPMMAPNGTRFGGWNLNTGDNDFGPAADYDGDGHDEIFISSPWGIGILKLSGGTLTAPMMQPNGTRFGGWLLNTADNEFGPSGYYDGDGHAEILVSSPWGLGILKMSGATMTAPMMQPNGTRFGGWLLNTADNAFGPAIDFDGDGRPELFIRSPWGVGILKQSGATMTVLMMAPNGTRFGGWLLNTADNSFGSPGKYTGGHLSDVFVTSPWGIGIFQLSGGTLIAPMMQPNGTRFGGWLLNTADNVF